MEVDTTDLYLASGDNLWEWELNEDHYVPLTALSDDRLLHLMDTIQYLKLLKVHRVREKDFITLDWTEAGVETFNLFSDLVLE